MHVIFFQGVSFDNEMAFLNVEQYTNGLINLPNRTTFCFRNIVSKNQETTMNTERKIFLNLFGKKRK